jgi:hypothetical protein
MSSEFYNQPTISLLDFASEKSTLLRLSWRKDYFSYYYFAYATVSGRCFAPGKFGQK